MKSDSFFGKRRAASDKNRDDRRPRKSAVDDGVLDDGSGRSSSLSQDGTSVSERNGETLDSHRHSEWDKAMRLMQYLD